MTNPLDTLRPEVREAVGRMVVLCSAANKTGKWVRADCDVVIVAELLRLASENTELRGANRRMKFLLDSAEAELAALKARIADGPSTQVSRMAAIGGGSYEWAGCRVPDTWNGKRVRLVVED